MDEKGIQDLIEKKLTDAKLDIADKRFNVLIVLAGILLTILGIIVPIWQTNTSTEKVENAIKEFENKSEKFYSTSSNKTQQEFQSFDSRIQRLESQIEQKLDKKINEYETKFDKITGESLKKPKLRLLYDGKSLDGQTISLLKVNNKYAIPALSIENVGSKSVEIPTVNIWFSVSMNQITAYSEGRSTESYWEKRKSFESFYPSQFQYVFFSAIREDISIINPSEIDELPIIVLENFLEEWADIDCLLKIYYSTEPPEIARFKVHK